MSRLFIALGYPDRKSESEPTVIYAGRDGGALAVALAVSPHAVHQIFARPQGFIMKHNPAAAANAARLPSPGETITVTVKDVEAYKAEMANLVKIAAERNAAADRLGTHVEDLQARIAKRVEEATEKDALIVSLQAQVAQLIELSKPASAATPPEPAEQAVPAPAAPAESAEAAKSGGRRR